MPQVTQPLFVSFINSNVGVANYALTRNSGNNGYSWTALPSANPGTVTSVALSGGSTGLTVSGSPITSSGTFTLSGTLNVANGGTGDVSFTTYSPLCGGTSSTGGLQSVLSIGSSGQSLLSQGAGNLPIFGNPTISLTTQVTNTLPVSSGGTGDVSFAANNTMLMSGTMATGPLALCSGWTCDSIGQMTGLAQGVADVPLTLVTAASPTATDNIFNCTSGGSSIFSVSNVGGFQAAGNLLKFYNDGSELRNLYIAGAAGAAIISSGTTLTFESANNLISFQGEFQLNTASSSYGLYVTNLSTPIFTQTNYGYIVISPLANASGAHTAFTITPPADTGITAGANSPNLLINGASRQWATGSVSFTYSNSFGADTINAVAASTFATASTVYIAGPPVAGTHATLTNAWSLLVASGNSSFAGPVYSGGGVVTSNNIYSGGGYLFLGVTAAGSSTGVELFGGNNLLYVLDTTGSVYQGVQCGGLNTEGGTVIAGSATFSGNVSIGGEIEISNSSSASVGVGAITGKFPIYNASGVLLGYSPIYSSIT